MRPTVLGEKYNLIFSLVKKKLILNGSIRADKVRLLDEDGTQIGIVPLAVALAKAKERELDLALVATHPEAPVCKLIDYGKHQYKQKKEKSRQKLKAKKADVKGIRIGLNTGQHDIEVKLKSARKFLGKGHPLKVQLQLKGRQMMYKSHAVERTKEFAELLANDATVDAEPRAQGYQVTMILIPKKGGAQTDSSATPTPDSPPTE